MAQIGVAGLLAFGLAASAVALPALAQSGPAPKWGPHIDLEARPGTDRSLGEVDLFIPLAQDADTLLFTSIRTRMDDSDGVEGNFGLGIRHMLDSGWNLGSYAYFDRRRTEWEHYFSQVTLGLEALSLDWDLRANAYLPQGRRMHQVDALNTAEVSGASVVFRGGEERAMRGFDAEVGWRLPLFEADAAQQLRVYAGGYHFTADNAPDITGRGCGPRWCSTRCPACGMARASASAPNGRTTIRAAARVSSRPGCVCRCRIFPGRCRS